MLSRLAHPFTKKSVQFHSCCLLYRHLPELPKKGGVGQGHLEEIFCDHRKLPVKTAAREHSVERKLYSINLDLLPFPPCAYYKASQNSKHNVLSEFYQHRLSQFLTDHMLAMLSTLCYRTPSFLFARGINSMQFTMMMVTDLLLRIFSNFTNYVCFILEHQF